MRKKLVVTLSVVFFVITVCLVLCWTLFALSSVSVDFESTTKNLTVTEEEIVSAGQFRYGASVLFEGKQSSIDKIYSYASENENFAYIKIENIETVFPNKFVIHISEREEIYAVEHNSKFLICDREFRVLDIRETFESTQENAILLEGVEVKNNSVSVGDFLDITQTAMKKFYSIMLANNRDYSQLVGKYQTITLSNYADELTRKEYTSLTMTTFQGKKFVVNNIDFAFSQKMQKLFATETALFTQNCDAEGNLLNASGEKIYVVKNKNGEYLSYEAVKNLTDDKGNLLYSDADKVALSVNLLGKCFIKVDNLTLTDYVKRTENDIYYSLVEDL